MAEPGLILDLVLAVVAAFVGGALAQRLGQPVLFGYLIAGVVIGPFTPGPQAQVGSISVLAQIGVAFLMFALGAEFSRRELSMLGRAVTIGGPLQIFITMGLGLLLAPALGTTLLQGLFVGAVLVHSSSVVALKVFLQRGEGHTLHGRLALAFSVAQDISVVPMIALLPPLVTGGGLELGELGTAMLKGAAAILVAYVVGTRVMPWLLGHVAMPGSREIFLLAVVGFALGVGVLTGALGLSLAFGAFLAGLALSESEYRNQVVAEVLPLRDLFTSLFFVSIGMLIDPADLITNIGSIALLLAVVIPAKALIIGGIVLLLGMPPRVAILTGLGLAQIGEIAFVLATVGVESGAMQRQVFDLVLSSAVVSIVVVPFLLQAAPAMLRGLQRIPGIGDRFTEPAVPPAGDVPVRGHAVICGYGRVARELSDALEKRGRHYIVVEYNPLKVRELRERGIPVVYGDASNPAVLQHANLAGASLLAVLMPDAAAAERTTALARQLNPRLDIVARASDDIAIEHLRQAGASDVVQPEFEAGVEVIRHALRRYGVSGVELANLAAGRRQSVYRRDPSDQH